jgi:hypothetical protein
VILLHELSVQLLEYKPGTLRIRIRVTVQILIRIRIIVKTLIRIRITVKIWIRIRITVKIWIRIRTDRWRSARGSPP